MEAYDSELTLCFIRVSDLCRAIKLTSLGNLVGNKLLREYGMKTTIEYYVKIKIEKRS